MIQGEHVRTIDDRWRVTLPAELVEALCPDGTRECILGKERYGALSLWPKSVWQQRIEAGVQLVEQKIRSNWMTNRIDQLQTFGRLLSTKYREVKIASNGRLLIPEGFREFLALEPGQEVVIVGAAVCLELWHPKAWRSYLKKALAEFGDLFETLTR